MAKFGSYFGLCPLIDHRSLLGISQDAEEGKVLVTLGGNIAMQHELSNQKQILSWTTKEKFTSPVIFDKNIKKYVAVFNQMCIRCWDYSTSNPDKMKPLKFKSDINTIIKVGDVSFVIFKKGYVINLKEALSHHKNLIPENNCEGNEYIKDILSCTLKNDKFIGLLIENPDYSDAHHLIVLVFNELDQKYRSLKINLKREPYELVGCTFHLAEQVQLLTLWSDGKLYSKSLNSNSEDPLEVIAFIESISCGDPVSMTSLDKDYIAMYGSNSNKEGALLVIYNMQFKVTQCKQPFKLVTLGARLWPIENNLILPVGQNLAVVPYHLETEQLSALVGSHRVINSKNNDEDISIIPNLEEVTWSEKGEDIEGETYWRKIYGERLDLGYSESVILQEIIPAYLKSENIEGLSELMNHADDIPDECTAELLQYVLQVPDEYFEDFKSHSDESYRKNLQPLRRLELLKTVLQKPVNEIGLVPYLRVKVTFHSSLKLLNFILFLLGDIEPTDIDFFHKLIDWISLILDAKYQSFRLSKDENVKKILVSSLEYLKKECSSLDDLQETATSVNEYINIEKKFNGNEKITKKQSNYYYVERIKLP